MKAKGFSPVISAPFGSYRNGRSLLGHSEAEVATIRKRGDKWQVQVRRKGFPPLSRSFLGQRDAERWATLKERELDQLEAGGLRGAKPCDATLTELLTRYGAEVTPLKRSASRERYTVAALSRAAFGDLRADRVSSDHLKAFRDARLRQVSKTTVVRELGLLHHLFELARTEWGFGSLSNPVRGVSKPKLANARTRRLGPGEEERLRSAALASRNPWLAQMMTFALETGMRAGEIIAARREHLSADKRVLLVPITKNGKARSVALSKLAVAVIASLPSQRNGLLFPTSSGALKQAWARAAARAGLPDIRFHDLRHEAVSRLFERGLDTAEVMMMSGHSDYRMLLRYTHLRTERLVEKLDRAWNHVTGS